MLTPKWSKEAFGILFLVSKAFLLKNGITFTLINEGNDTLNTIFDNMNAMIEDEVVGIRGGK